ncbi:MAG: hypothetical protein Q8R53_00220 [Nanoarchaeota archaeon]|nr:hypothetical protein [Nanoarchaeota archaeon]
MEDQLIWISYDPLVSETSSPPRTYMSCGTCPLPERSRFSLAARDGTKTIIYAPTDCRLLPSSVLKTAICESFERLCRKDGENLADKLEDLTTNEVESVCNAFLVRLADQGLAISTSGWEDFLDTRLRYRDNKDSFFYSNPKQFYQVPLRKALDFYSLLIERDRMLPEMVVDFLKLPLLPVKEAFTLLQTFYLFHKLENEQPEWLVIEAKKRKRLREKEWQLEEASNQLHARWRRESYNFRKYGTIRGPVRPLLPPDFDPDNLNFDD